MSASAEELAFTARARAHLDLCNAQSEQVAAEQVSMSQLYAAARYCAFMCTRANSSGAEMTARRDEAVNIFGQQFIEMFMQSYDEFAQNFPK